MISGHAETLWCEDFMVPSSIMPKIAIEAPFIKGMKASRQSANASLGVESCTGDNILPILERKRGWFSKLDKAWKVDEFFWSTCVGEGAGARWERSILSKIDLPEGKSEPA